jgi:hypothetical protein
MVILTSRRQTIKRDRQNPHESNHLDASVIAGSTSVTESPRQPMEPI